MRLLKSLSENATVSPISAVFEIVDTIVGTEILLIWITPCPGVEYPASFDTSHVNETELSAAVLYAVNLRFCMVLGVKVALPIILLVPSYQMPLSVVPGVIIIFLSSPPLRLQRPKKSFFVNVTVEPAGTDLLMAEEIVGLPMDLTVIFRLAEPISVFP